MRNRTLPAVTALLLLASAAHAQLTPDKALETFKVADGLEISLWASEPLFVNPTAIDVDDAGRVWVCEAVNYRRKLRGQPPLRAEGDRIVVLIDSDGDGKADKEQTFYQAPEIMSPLGVAVAKDADGPGRTVYVCQSPDLLVFEDKDGDLKADGPPKKLLTGFQGIDHDHGIHGVQIGPDGRLYFSVGDAGVKDLQASDGKGPKWTSNGTDCRAGTVWRCEKDGTKLELIAHNFRNNYMPAVDSFGSVFISDNDDDGNRQTRICYVMPGGNYGYHPRGPGQTHWHEEQPGVVHKILPTGFGSPTGMSVYEGNLLPKKYQGQLLHTDAGPREVRAYLLTPDGAGYKVEPEVIATSSDNWFRPSDVQVGPDGSIYVADWYDPGVGGHGMGDTTRGRIYRIAPKGNKVANPKVDLSTDAGILAALASPCKAVRWMAIDKLNHLLTDEANSILEKGVTAKSEPTLIGRASWIAKKAGRLVPASDAKDDRLTNLGFRIDPERSRKYFTSFPLDGSPLIETSSPAFRREVLLNLREADPEKAKNTILLLAKKYDGKDRFYLAALGIAVGTDPKRREVILADFDKQFPEWNDTVADLVWELRPPSVLPRLEKLVTDAKLTAAQRGRVVDILAATDDAAAGKTMLRLLTGDAPAEVRTRALDNLKLFLPGKWQGLKGDPALKEAVAKLLGTDDAPAEAQMAGLALISVTADPSNGHAIIRLIEKAKSPEVRREAIRAAGKSGDPATLAALNEFLDKAGPHTADAVAALGTAVGVGPTAKFATDRLTGILLSDKAPAETRSAALAALAGSRPGTQWLLDAHGKSQIPETMLAEAGRLLRASPHQDLRNKALIAFPAPGKIDPKKLPAVADLVKRTGDVENGKRLMAASLKAETQCLKCHMIHGVGGEVGPDLSMIGKKASKENLYDSILTPSKAIADQYIVNAVTTTDGKQIAGLLVAETGDGLTIRDATGKDYPIAKKDVDERSKSQVSLMPADIVGGLSVDELVDMVEYLFSLKTPSLSFDAWQVIGPFDNGGGDAGLDRDFGPEKKLDFAASLPGKAGPVKWKLVKPTVGYVDLAAHYGAEAVESVSYLSRSFESPVDQDATVLIGTDDGGKLWLNGELVHSNKLHEAAMPARDRVKVRLKKGTNVVLLKINNGGVPHGFYFTILSEGELKALPAEVK